MPAAPWSAGRRSAFPPGARRQGSQVVGRPQWSSSGPRVENAIEAVGNNVDDEEDNSSQQDRSHDDVHVVHGQTARQILSEAWPAEDGLDENGTLDQSAEGEARTVRS